MMTYFLRPFFLALGFLSRFPSKHIENASKVEWERTLYFYPLVGLLIGLSLALLAQVPTEPMLVAAMVCAFWVYITGSLHIDGLADWADAFVGGISGKQRTIEILKDPLCGPTAVAVTCLHLILKFCAIYTVIKYELWLGLIIAPVIARTLAVLMISLSDYITSTGIASFMINNKNKPSLKYYTIGLIIAIGLLVSPIACMLATITMFIMRRSFIKRLGGISGDGLGSVIELSEVAFLIGVCLY